MKKNLLCLVVFICLLDGVLAQKRYLRYNLPDGKSFIQANMRGQFWARYAEYNPGASINGEAVNNNLDFSMRRFRLALQSKLGEHFYIFSQIGGNNINQATLQKFRLHLLDLYGEYIFSPEFAIGAGKSAWDASSRASGFSNGSLLNLDDLGFSIFSLGKQDDSGRNLGVYAKGKLGKLDYKIAISTPPFIDGVIGDKVNFAPINTKNRYSSYIKYEFWDKESNLNAFSGSAGTYLGTKNVLSLGIGGIYQSKMMAQKVQGDIKYYDFKNLSVDLFMDKKISERGDAITSYLGYFYTDFGKDYIRNVGADNIASSTGTSFNGKGLDFPMMGTGSTMFFNFGYLFPKFIKSDIRIQPNVGVRYSNFKALKYPVVIYDAGLNVYLNNQANKLTLGYENRPIFNASSLMQESRKAMVVLQYQFEIR